MIISKLILCSLAASILLPALSNAQTDRIYRYMGSGDWTEVATPENEQGWRLGDGTFVEELPGLDPAFRDFPRINWGDNTVTVTSEVPPVYNVQIGVDESGTLIVADGGVVTSTWRSAVGWVGGDATGTLIVQSGGRSDTGAISWVAHTNTTGVVIVEDGGAMTIGDHIWWASGADTVATVEIAGTVTQTGGILGLGTRNTQGPSGGIATVNITGNGRLHLNNIQAQSDPEHPAYLGSIQPGSVLNLTDNGRLTIGGNRIGVLTRYVENGRITGNGWTGLDNVIIEHDSELNITTVTAVPPDVYDPAIFADFEMDFGIGEGKVDELSLLRNRPDSFILQDNALRLTTTSASFTSLTAVASVVNRGATQDFIVESELAFNQFPDVRASNVGLVLLGGPHEVPENRFNPQAEDGFYSLSFLPALQDSQVNSLFPGIQPAEGGLTSVIYISRGFQGEFLAAARWDGRQPLSESIVLADDFEDSSTDGDWVTGGLQNSWEIGTPSVGPTPVDGSRVAATNLDGRASDNSDDYLRSPPIVLTDSSSVISFREALNIDGDLDGSENPFHVASVYIVDEAGNNLLSDPLAQYSGNSGGWRDRSFPIPSEVLGQTIRVEFRLATDNFVLATHFGWMIDDFSVTAVGHDDGAYALMGEGNYVDDELQLTFTLTDLEDPNEYSQSVSVSGIADPFTGNLFGIGGRLQASPLGNPEIDFNYLSMSLDGPGIEPGFSYENWLDTMFTDPADRANPDLIGRSATPAGDGISNLLKYAFGFEPLTPVAGADLPQPLLVGDVLTLTYPERVDALGIAYQPEKSFNLSGWDSEGIERLSPTEPDGDFEWVTIQLELNGEERAFLRINVIELE